MFIVLLYPTAIKYHFSSLDNQLISFMIIPNFNLQSQKIDLYTQTYLPSFISLNLLDSIIGLILSHL